MKKIKIGNKFIGKGEQCFIVAEAGVNHNGDFRLAKRLVDIAKEAGADAVKFQTFKAEELVTGSGEMADYQKKNIGAKESQLEILKKLELDYREFIELKKYCDKKNIIFLSTPHCDSAIDFLEPLVPAYKIGSGDLTNIPFLEKIAKKKKPIILSTGMATLEEVRKAVEIILPIDKELILLHCRTNYPTPSNEVNLSAILTMKKEFNLPIGYSDHTEGIDVALDAAILDACVIEKHFTLDRNVLGPDHRASLEPGELKEMIAGIRDMEKAGAIGAGREIKFLSIRQPKAIGNGFKGPTQNESAIANVVRKSIVAAVDIKRGSTIEESMLIIKRPGTGIEPERFDSIIGRKAKKDIKKDKLITWQDL